MMKEKQIQREYEAIVEGSIHQKKQTITYPIARDRHDARKMRVSATGKHAKTTITLQKIMELIPGYMHVCLLVAPIRYVYIWLP